MRSFSAARLPVAVFAFVTTACAASIPIHAEPATQTHPGKVTIVASAKSKAAPTVKVTIDGSQTQGQDAAGLNSQEAAFVDLVNRERTSRGLNSLVVDPILVQDARAHSEEMCRLNYFDHHSPIQGMVTPMERYLKALRDNNLPSPSYALVGENIYYCSLLNDHYNVEFGHTSLMNSPGHRTNILEPRFVKIGVGTYRDAKGEFWVTEAFLRDTEPQTASTNP